ncbi:hypothetical protein [Mycolicibacterium sphagni]|uniref:PE family protein n=1 Tax=Mycolicibacterium sphagni TaxID=1786 RepID=A0A255DEQ2_9MYCO|nr:hypothetical protein [Mycolicibacterium sphagni]OYN77774.1 hypothetical protein CG716_18035 [Mycolicibacterium sphagni]
MAVGTIKTGKHGRNRALGIKTWLGAGALTVGVGAALAAGSGVAQADTGGHQASSSASSSSSNKPAAGPKRSSGVASAKRVAAPVKAASSTPSAADTKSAAASPAAGQTQTTTQTVNTPFGKITVDISATLPNAGTSGPVSLNLNASTPLGNVKFSLSGDSTFSPTPTITENVSITQGTLVVPAPVALLVSSAGSAVLGAYSAYTSATTFFSALQHGNVVGAAQAWFEGGPKLANALLFGQKALTLPIDLGEGAGTAQLSIPFGGFFAPLKPISVTWPGYSYTDQTSGAQVTIDPVDVSFQGTRFGGVGQALLQLFGLA